MTASSGQLFPAEHLETIELPGAQLTYTAGFYDKPRADGLFQLLQSRLDWRHEPITLFGKKVFQPRLTSWIADKNIRYSYSSIELLGEGWPGFLTSLRKEVEAVSGVSFNSLLANCYRDGKDSMGWHADDEPELGPRPVIASLSLGASRRFLFRSKSDHRRKLELLLEHGSLLIMAGSTQHFWQHSVPRSRGVNGPRINLTFRQILDRD